MTADETSGRGRRPDEVDALSGYNEPPEVPREEMWAAIREAVVRETPDAADRAVSPVREGERAPRDSRPFRRAGPIPVLRWSLAAAALLVLGIGIGRWSAGPTADGPTAGAPGPVAAEIGGPEAASPVRRVAYEHLTTAEAFLAGVRADARRGEVDASLGVWARRLLTQTRLLQDSPVSRDPELGTLLEDLELILVQVSRAADAQDGGGERAREELRLLSRGMERSDLNLRIEAALPASIEMIGT